MMDTYFVQESSAAEELSEELERDARRYPQRISAGEGGT